MDVGVFWDWVSLDQPHPRTGKRTMKEQARFEAAMLEVDLFFGHQGAVAMLLSSLPAGGDASLDAWRKRWKKRPYDASGWPTYERCAAGLKVFTRPNRLQCASWELLVEVGQPASTPT